MKKIELVVGSCLVVSIITACSLFYAKKQTINIVATQLFTQDVGNDAIETNSVDIPNSQNEAIDLMNGMYAVYWNNNTWIIDGIDTPIKKQLFSINSNPYYTDINLSNNKELVSFSNTPNILSVYNLLSGETKHYTNSNVQYLYDFKWTFNDEAIIYLASPEVFSIPDAKVGIYSVSLGTGLTTTLIDWKDDKFPYGIHGITLSPNETQIAFYAPRNTEVMSLDPEYAVYLLNLSCLQIPNTCGDSVKYIGDGSSPEWTSDGELSWICENKNLSSVCIKAINSEEEPRVFISSENIISNSPEQTFISNMFWSTDGKYVAINAQSRSPTSVNGVVKDTYLITLFEGKPIQVMKMLDENNESEFWTKGFFENRYLVLAKIIGKEQPFGDYEVRFDTTDLFLYDIQTRDKIDINTSTDGREVFSLIARSSSSLLRK
ncbi:MAG: hypothetical protein U0X74_02655 [Anaerolineales bacterium]